VTGATLAVAAPYEDSAGVGMPDKDGAPDSGPPTSSPARTALVGGRLTQIAARRAERHLRLRARAPATARTPRRGRGARVLVGRGVDPDPAAAAPPRRRVGSRCRVRALGRHLVGGGVPKGLQHAALAISAGALSSPTTAQARRGRAPRASPAAGIDATLPRVGVANAGAVYLFERAATGWSPGAYVKASQFEDRRLLRRRGRPVRRRLHPRAGAMLRASGATRIEGDQRQHRDGRGAVYGFSRSGPGTGANSPGAPRLSGRPASRIAASTRAGVNVHRATAHPSRRHGVADHRRDERD